ncbi:unnamed protein product [Prorocentrum cordatum]|nr:unnamed protein product [Polarella glacialis]
MFRELQRNMAAAFGNTERLRAMQVAVCPEKSGSVPFYVVDSERLVRDHPDTPKWAAKQLSSMDRHHIVKHARSLAMKRSAWEAYIQEIAVPCLTPADLLAAASLPPAQVDLLQVDAEGFDGKIVRTFLNLPEVNPKVIRFEQKHLPRQELGNLTSYLRARGYRVEQISSDVVAWREAELQIDGPRLQAPVAETHPPTRTALPCPEYVRVAGVPTAQSKRNGMFKQIGVIKEEGVIMNGGRPVFRSTNKQFLFYFARRKSWRIGNQPEAGQDGFGDGVISQDGEGAVCPTNAFGWHYFDGGWVPSSAITVEAAINVAPSQSKS